MRTAEYLRAPSPKGAMWPGVATLCFSGSFPFQGEVENIQTPTSPATTSKNELRLWAFLAAVTILRPDVGTSRFHLFVHIDSCTTRMLDSTLEFHASLFGVIPRNVAVLQACCESCLEDIQKGEFTFLPTARIFIRRYGSVPLAWYLFQGHQRLTSAHRRPRLIRRTQLLPEVSICCHELHRG